MNKKILALCLVVVLAVTAVTGATLAYFTDTTELVQNTFTVGDIEIDLDEGKAEYNEDTGDYDETEERVKGNEYEDIFPAQTLAKDPTVTVKADSEDCYVRIIVTVDIENLTAAFPKEVAEGDERTAYPEFYAANGDFLLQNLTPDWNSEKWECKKIDMTEGTYEFWYTDIVVENKTKGQVLEDLFETIVIPADATNANLAELVDVVEGEVVPFSFDAIAHAIQSTGFADATAAWAAFDAE